MSASPKRNSQESKVTSTPQSVSPAVFSLSPSISSIDDEVPMDVDSESEYKASREDSVTDLNVTALDEPGDHPTIRRRRIEKINFTGFWTTLKPKTKNSLYYKVMNNSEEIESIVIDLFNSYEKDEKYTVLMMLQLFVDLCGYKKLQIDKVYRYDQQNAKEVIDKMEFQLMESELKKSGKFLFMKKCKFETKVDYVLTEFLEHLVLRAFKTEVLFDEVFTGHILEFINCMSFSSIRCIRITGVVIVIKFLTAFVNLYNQFLILVQDENGNISEKIDIKKSAIETYIDFLYLIYDKNCLLPDRKCYLVKVKCAQEMFHWIKLFPEIFIFKRRCLGRLMKIVLDHNEIVRQNALATCEKLISCEDIVKDLTQRIELFLKIVSTRFLDTNFKVAIKAVNIFTVALQEYSEYITKSYKLMIIYRMFEKHVYLAKSAGKFLAAYLYSQNSGNEEEVLKTLVKIAFLQKEFADRICYFLHSCVEFIPELKNWKLLVDILLNSENDFKTRKHLLEILNETIRYTLTGKFSGGREIPSEEFVEDPEDHLNIAKVIISNFQNLIIHFQTDKKCLKQLIEILTFINYDHCRFVNLIQHITVVWMLLKDLFIATTDKDLLENLTTVFSHFSDKQYFTRAHVVIEVIKNNCVETLTDDLKQLSPTSDRTLLIRLREMSLKISLLMSKLDLTNILKWEEIFQVWDNNYLKVLKYLIVCCKWHLVWGLRRFIRASTDGDNTERVNHLLFSNCKDFTYGCLDMLKHASDNTESFLIFETFCDLYAVFEKELRRKREFSRFVVKITEPVCVQVLFDFVTRYIIENSKLLLDQRRKYLNKIIDVMFLGVIPVEYFSKILRFYHSHYEEFGIIMNSVLNQLYFAHPALPLLILHTLTELYKEILVKDQVVNLLSEDAKQLKLLAKKFALMKEMKSPNDLLKLINMSIIFAFRAEQNYAFLYFARYFANILNENGKSDAYHLFREMVPDKDKNNDIILIFASILKPSN